MQKKEIDFKQKEIYLKFTSYLFIFLCFLFGFKDEVVAQVHLPYTKPMPAGYHLEYLDDSCSTWSETKTFSHRDMGVSAAENRSDGQWGICGACGGSGNTQWYHKKYWCDYYQAESIYQERRVFDCDRGDGDDTGWVYVADFPPSCTQIVTVPACAGHAIPNPYYVNYITTADGSSGSGSQKVTYDSGFSLHSGSGFTRTWSVNFYGNTTGGSTTGTSSILYTSAPIVGWSWNGNSYGLSQYGTWNFTTVMNGTETLVARWGGFHSITVPTVSREGYILLGYTNNVGNSGVKQDGSTSSVVLWPGQSYTPSSNGESWYAIWKPKTYVISFDGNNLKYDTNHGSVISGKIFDEFSISTNDNTNVTGSTTPITVKFDGIMQFPTNGFVKNGKGYYGQNIKYNFVGWSQSKFASYSSSSRVTSSVNNRKVQSYYGYNLKGTLLDLGYATYRSGSSTLNSIYFYPNEYITNYTANGNKLHYNLSNGTYNVTLFANWVPENQRPYTYFRLATKQYYEDGRWNGDIEEIAYDSNPNNIYNYSGNAIVYNDMPIYLDTTYYDPEGRVDDGSFLIDYQYSIDGGVNWYELTPNIVTPNFTTTLVKINTNNLSNSKNLDGSYVIDNSRSRNIIYGYNYRNTSSETYMLEINFVGEENGKKTMIRNRACDTVTYPIMLTNVRRNEGNNAIISSTRNTLQKTLWSTGYYSKSYNSNVDGVSINEYTGIANSWNGQKAFVQNTSVGKTSGDNAGWYTKTIVCYNGNSTKKEDMVVVDFDNLKDMTYPMYNYNTNDSFILVSNAIEQDIVNKYGEINVLNTLKYRNYIKEMEDGTIVDWTTKYKDKTTIIRQKLSASNHELNINKKYTTFIPGDESVGFLNISVDYDNYKHYTQSKNPTYSIDNSYSRKYYHTGDNKDIISFNEQFSLYFIAIYDPQGNEVLTQASSNISASYDSKGIPKNNSLYTFSKSQTGLDKDLTGHIYVSYENMISDIKNRINATFAEYSDLQNGEYTIYIGVCDKSWNLYSPNKWALEKSMLTIQPRLSFEDIRIENFEQTGYKNEYLLDENGNNTTTKKPKSLFLKSSNGEIIETNYNGKLYRFPMYKLSGYALSESINGNKIYKNNYNLTQKQQYEENNKDYVADTSIGYKVNHSYIAKGGYNFSISVDAIGADYMELKFYSIKDNKPLGVYTLEEIFVGDVSESMKYSSRRQNEKFSFIMAFPEQEYDNGAYGMLYLYKTSITNPDKTIIRSIKLGGNPNINSNEVPLILFDQSLMKDLGVGITH